MENRTFAYLLLSCTESQTLIDELNGWYFGDIIEAFIESEDQAAKPEEIWTFGWGQQMTRIAPVQLTNGLDVRTLLLEALPAPIVRFDEEGLFGGSTILFPVPKVRQTDHSYIKQNDEKRLYGVLHGTVAAASLRNDDILFIGGWGWDYDMEIPKKQQRLLKKMGLPFVTRHI